VSLNPYASGEAALPAMEVAANAPKVAIAAAVLAGLSLLGIACTIGYMVNVKSVHAMPSQAELLTTGALFLLSVLLALIGMLLGIGALFIRKRPRLLAGIATFVNGAIVLCTVALFALSYSSFGGLD